jgi:hypothetical protein
MSIIVATVVGFVIFVVLWALGVKAFDGIWVVFALLLLAVTLRVGRSLLPGADRRVE